MKLSKKKRCKGQAIVEYIIIVVVVAIAALAIIGMFSDTIRTKIAGAASALGTEEDVKGEVDKDSADVLRELDAEGGTVGE
ncbi:MAG: hypothetical protein IJW05_04490 [Lentisphaeria bacterium]|nr:hypothetical protein [Lentisphaeria bacterium]